MKSRSRAAAMGLVIALAAGAVLFLCATLSGAFNSYGDSHNFDRMIIALIGGGVIFGGLCFGPVGRALGKMLEGESGHSEIDHEMLTRLSEIEYRLGEISGEVARVADIESRVEFSERLLNRLPGGEQK